MALAGPVLVALGIVVAPITLTSDGVSPGIAHAKGGESEGGGGSGGGSGGHGGASGGGQGSGSDSGVEQSALTAPDIARTGGAASDGSDIGKLIGRVIGSLFGADQETPASVPGGEPPLVVRRPIESAVLPSVPHPDGDQTPAGDPTPRTDTTSAAAAKAAISSGTRSATPEGSASSRKARAASGGPADGKTVPGVARASAGTVAKDPVPLAAMAPAGALASSSGLPLGDAAAAVGSIRSMGDLAAPSRRGPELPGGVALASEGALYGISVPAAIPRVVPAPSSPVLAEPLPGGEAGAVPAALAGAEAPATDAVPAQPDGAAGPLPAAGTVQVAARALARDTVTRGIVPDLPADAAVVAAARPAEIPDAARLSGSGMPARDPATRLATSRPAAPPAMLLPTAGAPADLAQAGAVVEEPGRRWLPGSLWTAALLVAMAAVLLRLTGGAAAPASARRASGVGGDLAGPRSVSILPTGPVPRARGVLGMAGSLCGSCVARLAAFASRPPDTLAEPVSGAIVLRERRWRADCAPPADIDVTERVQKALDRLSARSAKRLAGQVVYFPASAQPAPPADGSRENAAPN